MRRIVAVGRPADAEALGSWLARVPGIRFTVAPALDAVPWREVDALWVHGLRTSHPSLLSWVQSGGRLLATLDAAVLPSAMGLEPAPPDELRDTTWPQGGSLPVGLAAYGPHPLFEGLPQGAHLWQPAAGEPYRSATYVAARPVEAAVVALERVGDEVEARRIAAWEYTVGRGGILCIGSGVALTRPAGVCGEQLRIVLENALARDGIPAGPRRPGARHWPAPAARVVRRDLAPVPTLPGLAGPLGARTAQPEIASSAGPSRAWRVTGRRGFLDGSATEGLCEAWLHPFRIVADVVLLVDGTAPAVETLLESPVGVARRSRAGEGVVGERWSAALDHPILWWEVEADGDRPLRLEWSCDLRRAPPDPSGAAGDLDLAMAPDGRAATVAAAGDPFRLLVEVDGGTMEATPLAPATVRFTLRATGHARVRMVGAADATDWDRSAHLLSRRDLAALEGQRADHARELATYATALDTPEPVLGAAVEWAKLRMDAMVAGAPGVGRSAVSDELPTTFGATRGLGMALAQLALGDRGGPRDILKFLSLTATADGRLLRACATSGLGVVDESEATPHYLLLAARYAAWTAELDFLAHRWATIRRALEAGIATGAHLGPRRAHWREAMGALLPLAEALGHPEVSEALARHLAEMEGDPAGPWASEWNWADPTDAAAGAAALGDWRRLAPGLVDGSAARPAEAGAAVARAAVLGVWGVRPNALEGGVRLAPWFPPEWEVMALDRLRVGKSVLRVQLRRRFGQVAARVERMYGPRVHVEFVLRGVPESPVLVDDVELRGARVAFEAEAGHALVWPG